MSDFVQLLLLVCYAHNDFLTRNTFVNSIATIVEINEIKIKIIMLSIMLSSSSKQCFSMLPHYGSTVVYWFVLLTCNHRLPLSTHAGVVSGYPARMYSL